MDPDNPQANSYVDYVRMNYEMLTTDAIWVMPPFTGWYQGNVEIGRLIANKCPATKAGDMRMVPTTANGQPAFGLYMRGLDGRMRPFQLQQTFGLPAEVPAV